MTPREERGLQIAATKRIKQQNGKWLVPSSENASRKYTVCHSDNQCSCTCPDFEERGQACKHVYAVQFVIQRELFDDGTEIETRQVTVTEMHKSYGQNWAAYNASQTSEKALSQSLLYDLCKCIQEPTETRLGRPRLPVRDGIFAACMKVYSQLSSRRFTSDLCDAQAKGYISRVPHFNSVLNVFDNEEMTPVLRALVAKSAEPLAAIEQNFAIDSTGFSGCRFDKWFDVKWNNAPLREGRVWVKAHAVIGALTNVVTAVEITENNSADAPFLPQLLSETAERFTIGDVCADKAYLSEMNLHAITSIGARAYIPFKSNSKPTRPGVWNTAYHYFNLHREEFLSRYHQRSNVESTFSAIKRKFGDSVKAKNGRAMINETMAKFVCHNLSCLIHAMNEFGIDPNFGCTKMTVPAQIVGPK
jgi:transposase